MARLSTKSFIRDSQGQQGSRMKVLRLSALIIGILPISSAAYFYEVKALRKWYPERGKYHYFIGYSDFHDKSSEANKKQLTHLDSILSNCDKSNTKIMVEDLSSPGAGGRMTCGRFLVNSRGGVLGGSANKYRDQGFDVENVEYRYCRVSALGPVLNNLTQNPHNFPSVTATSVMTLAQEVDAVMDDITTYNDGQLQKHYQQTMHPIKEQINKWKQKDCCDLNVAQYLMNESNQADRLDLLKHLLTFDSGLLDLKMVHTVVNSDKQFVIALSGGAHITRVSELLEAIGYENLYGTEVQFHKEYDLNKCLGSNIIDGSYCVRPEPIELDAISSLI